MAPMWHQDGTGFIPSILARSFGFRDERGQLLAERSRNSFCNVDRRLAFAALQEPDIGVMDAGGFGERFLREPFPSAVFSHHASERRGELR